MCQGDWSSGMIPASGAGGREFDSRITPFPEHRHSSLGVEHSLSKRKVVGSNPACGFLLFLMTKKKIKILGTRIELVTSCV